MAKLQVLSGAFAGRELELTKALTTLGRPGVQVAAITRRAMNKTPDPWRDFGRTSVQPSA